MQIVYFCDGISAADTRRDEQAIQRFSPLACGIIAGLQCSTSPLGEDTKAAVLKELAIAISFTSGAAAVADILFDHFDIVPRLVVCCDGGSELAIKAKTEKPSAAWGAACPPLVAIYHHEPALIWHELFHLLGADDCYAIDERDIVVRDRTCGHDNCIMQYAPALAVVGDPPFICGENVSKMQKQFMANV